MQHSQEKFTRKRDGAAWGLIEFCTVLLRKNLARNKTEKSLHIGAEQFNMNVRFKLLDTERRVAVERHVLKILKILNLMLASA